MVMSWMVGRLWRRCSSLLCSCLALWAVALRAQDGPPREPRNAADAVNAFTCDLHRALPGSGNCVASAWSIAATLAMVRLGARGETAAELDRLLHTEGVEGVSALADLRRELSRTKTAHEQTPAQPGPAQPGGSRRERSERELLDSERNSRDREQAVRTSRAAPARPVVCSANAVWVSRSLQLEPGFVTSLDNLFAAPPERVDFTDQASAREAINRWVEEITAGAIRDLVPSGQPSPQTRLMLADAIHLRVAWEEPFHPEATSLRSFATTAGTQVEVPTMHQTATLGHAMQDRVELLEKPLLHDLAMVVLLPRKGSSLTSLEGQLSGERLQAWIQSLQDRTVQLWLPKFEVAAGTDLTRVLEAMGAEHAFAPARADLSGISKGSQLAIGSVLHRVRVMVDEAGTEAAAATVAGLWVGAVPTPVVDEPVLVRVDRPFLFLIRDRRTGAILFLGRVADPRR